MQRGEGERARLQQRFVGQALVQQLPVGARAQEADPAQEEELPSPVFEHGADADCILRKCSHHAARRAPAVLIQQPRVQLSQQAAHNVCDIQEACMGQWGGGMRRITLA
jgi:hypothetical protein